MPEIERHYKVADVAELWGLSETIIREMFTHEPGVLKIERAATRHKRAYVTLRIPHNVLERVHRRRQSRGE